MNACFDRKVDRTGDVFWLKNVLTPPQLQQQGLLSYCGAEFEFPTCPAFSRGVQEAAAKGLYGYTLPRGKYLERVQWWMKQVRHYDIEAEWVVATHGTIFSLATTIRMLTRPGDSIITLVPTYNRYEQAATRLGRGTVRVPMKQAEGTYSIDWAALECAMAQPRNKILVLCNPNNPTGQIFPRAVLEQIALLSKQYDVTVYADEIFADIVFEGKTVVPYTCVAGKDAMAITCTSLGKTFSLTGVNHANVIIENDSLRQRFTAQRDADHYGSVDPMLHAGLLGAYTPEGYAWLEEFRSYVWENYLLVWSFLKENLPEAVVTKPEGSFVLWVDYEKTGLSGKKLNDQLLSCGFMGDAGEEYFGKTTCVRYCLAVPRGELLRSLEQMKHLCQSTPSSFRFL